jgi:hypothetical protein
MNNDSDLHNRTPPSIRAASTAARRALARSRSLAAVSCASRRRPATSANHQGKSRKTKQRMPGERGILVPVQQFKLDQALSRWVGGRHFSSLLLASEPALLLSDESRSAGRVDGIVIGNLESGVGMVGGGCVWGGCGVGAS